MDRNIVQEVIDGKHQHEPEPEFSATPKEMWEHLCELNPAFKQSDDTKIVLQAGQLRRLVAYCYGGYATHGFNLGVQHKNNDVFLKLRRLRAGGVTED